MWALRAGICEEIGGLGGTKAQRGNRGSGKGSRTKWGAEALGRGQGCVRAGGSERDVGL